jgi:pyruvate,water dikinase
MDQRQDDEQHMNGMHILWLGEPAAHDAALVGGKVANLSQLAGAYPVPEGFCLTAAAFECSSPGQLARELDQALRQSYAALATQCQAQDLRVAVRSSAADEDGNHDSFAGQHDTYLNVQGASAVAAAVQRCWASAYTPRTLAYRQQRGLSQHCIRLAVLVQRLVPAGVSAVVFSANPLTGARDELVINASWGLGESIVGGLVTPDMLIVDKAAKIVRRRQIADKRRMTVSVPGGTHEVDVPRVLRTRPALSDKQVAELAALGCSLEQRMGYPVDIECAYQGDMLYLLQCRPITTFAQTHSALSQRHY